jgi:hypothetical protein
MPETIHEGAHEVFCKYLGEKRFLISKYDKQDHQGKAEFKIDLAYHTHGNLL